MAANCRLRAVRTACGAYAHAAAVSDRARLAFAPALPIVPEGGHVSRDRELPGGVGKPASADLGAGELRLGGVLQRAIYRLRLTLDHKQVATGRAIRLIAALLPIPHSCQAEAKPPRKPCLA